MGRKRRRRRGGGWRGKAREGEREMGKKGNES